MQSWHFPQTKLLAFPRLRCEGLTQTWPIRLSLGNLNKENRDTRTERGWGWLISLQPTVKGKSFSSCFLDPHADGKLSSQVVCYVAILLDCYTRNLYQDLDCDLVFSEKGKWYILSVYNQASFGERFPWALGYENSCFLKCWKVKVKCWMCFKFWDNTSRFQSWCLCVRAYVCVQNWGGKAVSKTLLWKMPKHWATYLYGKDLCVWMKPVSFINTRLREAWLLLPCFWTFVHIKQFPSPWLLNFPL